VSLKRINLVVRRLARKAGITYKKITPHTLRHTFATRLVEKGVDMKTVQELLGHLRIGETARYVHPAEGARREAVEQLTNK
jgi:integrase/recombinase XerD